MRDLTFKFHCVTSSGSSAGCLFKCFCEFMHVVGKQLEGWSQVQTLAVTQVAGHCRAASVLSVVLLSSDHTLSIVE